MLTYRDECELIQHVPVVTVTTAWTCQNSGKTFILVFNEAVYMEDKLDHYLVNPNQMRHHCIYVQENPCMQKPMDITCPQEDMKIPLYMSGTIVCADTSLPTK